MYGQSDLREDVVRYGKSEGLSHNHVFQSFEDSRGFIWLITESGLDFFNGTSFETVQHWRSLSVASGISIRFEDAQGNLWIRIPMEHEKVRYSLVNIHTKEYKEIIPRIASASDVPVFDVALGRDQTILECDGSGGLWQVKPDGASKLIYKCREGNFSFCVPNHLNSYIWISTIDSTGANRVFISVRYDGSSCRFESPDATHLGTLAGDGSFWSIGHNSFARLEPFKPAVYQKIASVVKGYIPDDLLHKSGIEVDQRTEAIWMVNQDRLMIWHPTGGLIFHFLNATTTISPKTAFQIMIDRKSNAWVATIDGLYKVSVTHAKFHKILWVDTDQKSNKQQRPCRGIIEHSSGEIYINAGNGLFSYDRKHKEIRQIWSKAIGNYALAEDLDGSLLCALGDVIQIDLKTGTSRVYSDPTNRLIGNIWSIWPRKERVWLGNNKGLIYYNRRDGVLKKDVAYNGFSALQNAEIYQFYPKKDGKSAWILTDNGLYELNEQHGIVARYWKGGIGRYFLPSDHLRHLCEDGTGGFWFATAKGLLHWDPEISLTSWYTDQDGLINDNLYAVFKDAYGFLWYSSDGGIGQFQESTEKIRNFNTLDGITHNEFNRVSYCQVSDGTILFGGMNGVTMFHPKDFYKDFNLDPDISVVLSKAAVFSSNDHKEINILPKYYQDSSIFIAPGDRYLKLHFSLAEYSNPNNVEFSYKIEGLVETWNTSNLPEIQLASLPYGAYTLVMRARCGNGLYSLRECRIRINVPPPYYLTIWFRFFILFVTIAIVYLFFQYRIRMLRIRQIELEEQVAARTLKITQDKHLIEQQSERISKIAAEKSRFLANLTHELRTPLALIMDVIWGIQTEKDTDKRHHELISVAMRSTRHLLKMVNGILYLSKTEFVNLRLNNVLVGIDSIVRPLVADYRIMAEKKGIKMRYIAEKAQMGDIIVDPEYVSIIVGNLLSNAVKFTDTNGQITVLVENDLRNVRISVHDTGRGIHPSDLFYVFERYYQTQVPNAPVEGGSGIGLSLAKELTELMGGEIGVESDRSGSKFYVSFPLSSNSAVVCKPAAVEPACPVDPVQSQNKVAQRPFPSFSVRIEQPKILVVEDHPDYQYVLKSRLQKSYNVHCAFSGTEALAYLESNAPPDLILCDVMMPGMDGIQLISQIRCIDAFAQIPVIFLTALNCQENQLKAMRLGVDDYLTKPTEPAVLIKSIQTLLCRSSIRANYGTSQIGISDTTDDVTEHSKMYIEWMIDLEKALFAGLSDPAFSVDKLAQTLLMSRTAFYQQINRLTGMTPNQYIQEGRLQQARMYLENGSFPTVKGVVEAVGMRDVKYFSRLYANRFHKSITTYKLK